MNKDEKQIMVVNNAKLFGKDYFEGFSPASSVDFLSRMLMHYEFMKRKFAEHDLNFKQPIPYAVIVNPKLKLVFGFKRSGDKNAYHENRLHGKWALGVGGHIEPVDTEASSDDDPIYFGLLREIEEEVNIKGSKNIKLLGYINHTLVEVDKYHLGLLYLVETDATEVSLNEPEIEFGKLMSVSEFENIFNTEGATLESWGKIALEPVKEYLERC